MCQIMLIVLPAGITIFDISDHLPIFENFNLHHPTHQNSKPKFRCMKHFDPTIFLSDLRHKLINLNPKADDVNTLSDEFVKNFNDTLDTHSPYPRGGARGLQGGPLPPKILPGHPSGPPNFSAWRHATAFKSYTDHWQLPLLQNWPLQWPPQMKMSGSAPVHIAMRLEKNKAPWTNHGSPKAFWLPLQKRIPFTESSWLQTTQILLENTKLTEISLPT